MPKFKRTNFAHDETVSFDNGLGKIGFFTPSTSPYFGTQETPHDNTWSDGTPSFLPPVSHYHLLQQETFHVVQGRGAWTLNNNTKILSKSDSITIPARSPHRFESVPNSEGESLIVSHKYTPDKWEMQERFTRNLLCYMWDCKLAGIEPSILQICVFVSDAWIAAEVYKGPGGILVACVINTIITWIAAAVGLLMGYKKSYIEYYDPEWSAKRLGERKGQ